MDELEVLARRANSVVQPTLVLRCDPDLVSQVAGVTGTIDERGAARYIHRAMIQEAERRIGNVFVRKARQQLARAWAGNRETHEPHVEAVQADRAVGRLLCLEPAHVI